MKNGGLRYGSMEGDITLDDVIKEKQAGRRNGEKIFMKNHDQFNKEVKQLLSGNISDENIVNYLAIKITKLHEQHMNDICKESKE